jgi:hypothetical protein
MKKLWLVLLLSSSFLLAQDSSPSNPSQGDSKAPKGQVAVRGCVGRMSGDYILTQVNPGMTYQLQGSGKTKVRQYLGQEVEVTGTKQPTLSSSSDAMAKMGSAAPVTIIVTSIKTINKECRY